MTNKFGVGNCEKDSLCYKYLGMTVSFQYEGITLKGVIREISTYSKRPVYNIEVVNKKCTANFYLDKNSFKEI